MEKKPLSHYLIVIVCALIGLSCLKTAAYFAGQFVRHHHPMSLLGMGIYGIPLVGAFGVVRYKNWGRWLVTVGILPLFYLVGVQMTKSFHYGFTTGDTEPISQNEIQAIDPENWMYFVGFGSVSLMYIPIVFLLFKSKASKMYRVEQTTEGNREVKNQAH